MKIEIATVFLVTGGYGRTTIAGWSYDRDLVPKNKQWMANADGDDWADQIVDFARRFPIEEVWMRFPNRPFVEHTIEQWAKKYKRVEVVAKILMDRRSWGT